MRSMPVTNTTRRTKSHAICAKRKSNIKMATTDVKMTANTMSAMSAVPFQRDLELTEFA